MPAFPLQPASEDIWDKKYCLKKKDGTPVDDAYSRVARALSEVEKTPALRKRRIERHLTTSVPKADNIEIVENGVFLTTSIRHPVLVKGVDLENTTYRFELDTGTAIAARGNEQIKYAGEVNSAANLYDALTEGYYGKF